MAAHDAPSRRWRASVAMHNLTAPRKSPSCSSSHRYPHGHWQDLSSYISALESSDLALKTESLHQLSLFLLYMAPTSESSFNCPDAQTISASIEDKDILIALKDVQVLYSLLFSELAKWTTWLFKQEVGTKEYESICSIKLCGSQCDHLNLVFIVKVLQCCIHILPLLEFNTALSLVAAEALFSLLKQLTCPTNLLCYNAKGFCEIMDKYRKPPYTSGSLQAYSCFWNANEHSIASAPWSTSAEASIRDLQDLSSQINTNSGNTQILGGNFTACSLHNTRKHTGRHEIASALLEVFIEELLLQPRLAEVLLASNVLDLSRDLLSCEKLTMEAAAMHFIGSFFEVDGCTIVVDNHNSDHVSNYGPWMSLPAAVMLLDLSIIDAPDLWLLHIVSMLRRAFNNPSCLTLELPEEMVVGLAASTLESAAALYLRCWKPGSLPLQHSLLHHGNFLKCLSDKIWAMCEGDNDEVSSILGLLFNREGFVNTVQQEQSSRHPISFTQCVTDATFCQDELLQCSYRAILSACYDSINDGQEPEQAPLESSNLITSLGSTFHGINTALMISVLHLMSTALLSIVCEADKYCPSLSPSPWRKMMGNESRGGHSANAGVYISSAKEVFKFCASVDRKSVLKELKLDKEMEEAALKVDELTENAFTFFAERLHLSLKQGAPKALCEAYLYLLKALLTLSFSFEQGRKLSDTVSDGVLCKVPLIFSHDVTMTTMEQSNDAAMTRMAEEQSNAVQDPSVVSHDAAMTRMDEEQSNTELCCDESGLTSNFVSSTLSLTKRYQRKHRKVVLSQKNSHSLPRTNEALEREHMDGVLHPQTRHKRRSIRKSDPHTPEHVSLSNVRTYIDDVMACEGKVDGDCFSDLHDFIVCKEGRNYSKWMKSLYKKRKKKQRKVVWQRLKAKRCLVSLLTRRQNDLEGFHTSNTT